MTISDLKNNGLLFFEAISGSRAYGTDLPTSDEDVKGVFILPKKEFYGLHELPQVSDEQNDQVYYELRRFFDLLSKNNPNLLELLATPEDCICHRHPLFERIRPELFLSKLCKNTFAGYAITQIQKARGLNKKIVNPIAEERKTILDFCYVIQGQGSMPLNNWLKENSFEQKKCGLVKIPHFRDAYSVFYDKTGELGFRGIMQKTTSNDVVLSSTPKGMQPVGIMNFNLDGYKTYCKDYREYWDWVKKRNEVRYSNTVSHGKNYDAKNMLHTFRLLDMATEIASMGKINVRRPNRDFLLEIRSGKYDYEELLKWAKEKIDHIEELFEESDLPEQPDMGVIETLLFEIREDWYAEK